MPNDPVKFLLVDDLEENLLALEGLLRRQGLELLKARTGPQALELLLVHEVALAIVDVQMPGMDGFELAELMRGTERTRRIPIIFVTAGAVDMRRRFQGYEAGAVDFLFKPIEPRILQSKAEVFFELYRQRQEVARQRDQLRSAAEENARLLEESRRAEEALRELNATLESKVAQRTAQLQHRTRQLQKLTLEVAQTEDRERKRMAEILHDDLQQIIAGAKFHLSLMRNRVKYDASVQAIVAKIDEMLKDAIEKSRGLSHELSPAVLHQGDFTETLRWLARQMQAKHGLAVHVRACGRVPLRSEATRGFLYRTAQELLFNVVKHARVTEATLRIRQQGESVYLMVSDRGRGFDPCGLRETAGFGLLSIRERIELLGGRMKIQSTQGKGSRFFIVVPDREAAGTAAAADGALPGPAQGVEYAASGDRTRLRVLLADDHRIVREGLRSLLREEYNIEIVGEAVHGREAIDLTLRLKPDVVIMDVSMPLINGDEATRHIKEHLPQTRVIALSTYNEPETIQKMYRAGAEGYVLKTACAEELLAAIRGEGSNSQTNPL
jgi:response regulator RpfG family c-di-GMP phosphodiesterase